MQVHTSDDFLLIIDQSLAIIHLLNISVSHQERDIERNDVINLCELLHKQLNSIKVMVGGVA